MDRFDAEMYERIRPGCQRSAETVAAIVADLVQPDSVVDVGCGEGWWGSAFAALGVGDVVGMELETPDVRAPGVSFQDGIDLTVPGWHESAGGTFDLAVCLEVAEHLPEEGAETLIDGLVALAPVILFSAAIPGQGGHGHLNERWPAYWASLLEARGYEVSGELRWRIWDDPTVEPWYRQNLLVAVARHAINPDVWSYLGGELFGEHAHEDPIAVVHPDIYAWRVQEIRSLRGTRS